MEATVFGVAAIAIAAFHGPTWAWAVCVTLALLILAVRA